MKQPNIVLISIDTLRADHLSCYGYHKNTSPNIDRIAAEGTVFRKNFSSGVWTPPGHASMLTGLYVSEHGVHDENRLHKDIPTIAETLKNHGYQTAGFVNNSQVGKLVGFERGHDAFYEVWMDNQPKSFIKKAFLRAGKLIKAKLGYEDLGARATNRLYRNWLKTSVNDKSPFYAFLHYAEPHNPLDPPHPFKDKYIDKTLKNVDMRKIKKVAYNPLICFVEDMALNGEEIDVLNALYDGEIEYIDSRIGEVVQILKENGIYDETMIVITADHGEHFGEHGLWSHVASLYKEVLHIPLIIKFPKGVEHVRESGNITHLVDIFPTVMDVAGISGNDTWKISGVSLVHNSKNDKFHDHIYAEWEGRVPYFIKSRIKETVFAKRSVDMIINKMWMITDGNYKYILKADGKDELYDMENDSGEQNDLTNKHNEIAAEMKKKLNEFRSGSEGSVKEQFEVDEETRKNLEALGYM